MIHYSTKSAREANRERVVSSYILTPFGLYRGGAAVADVKRALDTLVSTSFRSV